ncbi:MAG: 16S rRNA (uracil(1498)-N(3))-methyltransferase [Pseudomonadota bacterium]
MVKSKGSAVGGRSAPRLFVDARLAAGAEIAMSGDQTHYLLAVMRRAPGDPVIVFNGVDGEWSGHVAEAGRRACKVAVTRPLRAQGAPADIQFLFAPIKRARLDFIVQKATELGVARITPVMTRLTNVGRVNTDRLHANVIEAAEQCGALWVPQVEEPLRLDAALAEMASDRRLVFCDEAAPIADPVEALKPAIGASLAVLVGPEGGFSPDERDRILARDGVVRLSVGPRILRADTAGIAALSLVQAVCGDWRGGGSA